MKEKFFFLLLVFHISNILSSDSLDQYYPKPVGSSSSNYGITGVLEIPNARFMDEASISWNFSGSFPNEYTSITATPFSWLEAAYRYLSLIHI